MQTAGEQSQTYLVYVDDSGDERHDVLITFCVPLTAWAGVLGYWKSFRRTMERQWGIPRRVEFHSVEMVSRGRGTLPDPAEPEGAGRVYPQEVLIGRGQVVDRIGLYRLALTRIAEMNGGNRQFGVRLHIIRKHAANGSAFLYRPLVHQLQEWLRSFGHWAIVWVDGTDPAKESELRVVHRALDLHERRILEDASLRDSVHSHFLQIADVCAYAAFKDMQYTAKVEERKRLGTALDIVRGFATITDLNE